MGIRLDKLLVDKQLAETRSQAENYIKLGKVSVNDKIMRKPGSFIRENSLIKLDLPNKYVSRAGLKLASVAKTLRLDFRQKTVLDVGSSTGGFTDFALQNGAKKVIAVDVGTNQMHKKLRFDGRVELHEKTDIRQFDYVGQIDIVLIDVSFISLREILPYVAKLATEQTCIVAMLKPQFEAGKGNTERGIVKNNAVRKKIVQEFEQWCKRNGLIITTKRDSGVKGAKGNQERFYLLKKVS